MATLEFITSLAPVIHRAGVLRRGGIFLCLSRSLSFSLFGLTGGGELMRQIKKDEHRSWKPKNNALVAVACQQQSPPRRTALPREKMGPSYLWLE